MAPKLTGYKGNSRVRRVLAAAALAGVELDFDESFSFKSEWKTPEFLAKFPLGYLPVLEDGDLKICESAAIAEYGTLYFLLQPSTPRPFPLPSPLLG